MKIHSRREFLLTTLAIPLVAQAALGAQAQTKQPMKIAFIGSGRQGGALGLQFAKAGHEVMFSSRTPESLKDLVAKAGAKARAGLAGRSGEVGRGHRDRRAVRLDTAGGEGLRPAHEGEGRHRPWEPDVNRDGPMATEAIKKGTGVASAEFLPGVRLVRAFNALSFVQVEREAHRAGEKLGIPIAGDDPAAVATVVRLVEDAGFDPVVVGGLARGARVRHRDTGLCEGSDRASAAGSAQVANPLAKPRS